VGLIASLDRLIRMAPRDGDRLVLIVQTRGRLGQSALLAELFGREEGDAPTVDLAAERSAGAFLRAANTDGLIAAAHDLSDGGLALAAAEMALASGLGIAIEADEVLGTAEWFFGEDQCRYLVACAPEALDRLRALAATAGVPFRAVGAAGGTDIRLGSSVLDLDQARRLHGECLALLLD
jgi:phosphoribosylformylglycinamidine synthase